AAAHPSRAAPLRRHSRGRLPCDTRFARRRPLHDGRRVHLLSLRAPPGRWTRACLEQRLLGRGLYGLWLDPPLGGRAKGRNRSRTRVTVVRTRGQRRRFGPRPGACISTEAGGIEWMVDRNRRRLARALAQYRLFGLDIFWPGDQRV